MDKYLELDKTLLKQIFGKPRTDSIGVTERGGPTGRETRSFIIVFNRNTIKSLNEIKCKALPAKQKKKYVQQS